MTGISEIPLDQPQRSGPEASSNLEQEEQVAGIMSILRTLPANQQEVLRLKFQSDLSYLEISQVTSLSVSNVGFLIHTGIKTIRERAQSQAALRRVK